MQPWGFVSNGPIQMEEPPEWTAIVAKLIAYEVFSHSTGDRVGEERWPPRPHLEPRWFDITRLFSAVRDSLLPQTIDVILNNTLLISLIIFFVIFYSGIVATFIEELQRRRLKRQIKYSYEPPAANSSGEPKAFMDWRPPPSRARKPPLKPDRRPRIFSKNEDVQLANDTYKMKDRGDDVGAIKGSKRKSCGFPGSYSIDECGSARDTEVSVPIESRDRPYCSAARPKNPVLSGLAGRYRNPSRPAAPESDRANISCRTVGPIDALNTMHARITLYGEAQSKAYQEMPRGQNSLPSLSAHSVKPLHVHNGSAPVPTRFGTYSGTSHSREVQLTRKKVKPVQVVNTIERSERSALVGPYTSAPRPTPRPSFRCPDSLEPESRQDFTPAPTHIHPRPLAPLPAAVHSPSPVPAPEPAFVRARTSAASAEHINPRKRRRIIHPVETESEQGEPPRKVRKGSKGDSISTHFHNTKVLPHSIFEDTAKIEVKDILGVKAIYVDENGMPDYKNPCHSRKDGEEWSGRIWKMRMTDEYRERLCDIECIYPRSLKSSYNCKHARLHAWLTDEHYRKAIIHQKFGLWKVTSVEPVQPGAPVDEWLLKEGERIGRGLISESPHGKESTILVGSDPSTSTPPNIERHPSKALPQPRPPDEKEPPPTNIVEVGEEQVATLDTADDHTAERVDSIANNSMEVEDDPTDAMDLCSSPLLPPTNPLHLPFSQGNTQQEPNSLGTSFTFPSAFVSPVEVVAQRDSRSSNIAVPSQPTQAIPVSSQAPTQLQNPAHNWPPFTFDHSSNLFKLPTRPGDKKSAPWRPRGAKSRPRMLPGGRNLSKGTPPQPNLPSSSSFNVSSTNPTMASLTSTAPQNTGPPFSIAPNLPGAQPTMTPPQASSSASLNPGQTGLQSALSLNDTNSGFTAGPSGTGVLGKAMFGGGKLPLAPLSSGDSANMSGSDVGASGRAGWRKNTTPPPLVDGERQLQPVRKSWRPPPFGNTHTVSATPTDPHLAGFRAPGTSYSAQDTPATSFASQFSPTALQAPDFTQRQFLEEQRRKQEVYGQQNQFSQHRAEGYQRHYERGLGGDFTNI